MPTPILTACRQAVWTAIDTHVPLQGKFKRKYKYEDRPGGIPGPPSPTAGDLNAIELYPTNATTPWTLNQSMRIEYPLEFRLWTRDWQVTEAEFLWEEIVKALYQQMEPTSGANNRVLGFSPMTSQIVQLGDNGPIATRWTFQVNILAAFWNPRTT